MEKDRRTSRNETEEMLNKLTTIISPTIKDPRFERKYHEELRKRRNPILQLNDMHHMDVLPKEKEILSNIVTTTFISNSVLEQDLSFIPTVPLTSREKSVMLLISKGLKRSDIADQLNISTGTVNGYVTAINKKFYNGNLKITEQLRSKKVLPEGLLK